MLLGVATSAVSSTDLQAVTDGIQATVTTIMPVAIGLFVLFFGIKLVPKLIKKFAK
jgi:hypothetical protein